MSYATTLAESSLKAAFLEVAQSEQAKKAKIAQSYRAEVLKKQEKKQQVPVPVGGGAAAAIKKKTIQKGKKATFAQCAFNLANILMGVGMLGLPFVFRAAGWLGGLFSVILIAIICWRTAILIGRELNGDPRPSSFFDDHNSYAHDSDPDHSQQLQRMLPPTTSFPDIARCAFGKIGCLILSFLLYFELFSCICVFFVTIGAHLHELFPGLSAAHHSVGTALLSLFPTVVLKTPALLSYLSMVGTLSTMALVLSVILSALVEGDDTERVAMTTTSQQRLENHVVGGPPYHILWDSSGLPLAFGLVSYCFSGHAIVPAIYRSMERPQDFERMVTMTFAVVLVCSVAVAASGYIMFGSFVQDQVTLSMKENVHADVAMNALVALMILTGKLGFIGRTLSSFLFFPHPILLHNQMVVGSLFQGDIDHVPVGAWS
jgi:solute carrier family 32 (vesicular inhibitory amino acid transporter)